MTLRLEAGTFWIQFANTREKKQFIEVTRTNIKRQSVPRWPYYLWKLLTKQPQCKCGVPRSPFGEATSITIQNSPKINWKKVVSCDRETIEVLASHLLKAEPSWFVTWALPNFLAPAAKSEYWFLQCAGVVKKSLSFQQILYNSRTLLESIFKLKQCNRHFAQTSEVSSSWFSFQGKVWYRLSPALLPENCYFWLPILYGLQLFPCHGT